MTLPVVRVWHPRADGVWRLAGLLGDYETLAFTPTLRDVGAFSMTLPASAQAALLTAESLLTVDWRGRRSTWRVRELSTLRDGARTTRTVSGDDALALLGRTDAWPDPTKGILSQPTLQRGDPAPYQGPAETVVKRLVSENVAREGYPLRVEATAKRGGTVRARPDFDDLLTLVLLKSARGGIIPHLGLVNVADGSDTRAHLTFSVTTPRDRARAVRLSGPLGTVADWKVSETAPTCTRAVVVDKDDADAKVRVVVTTPTSEAVAARWGGHWTRRVVGPGTSDVAELTEAGEEAILQGSSSRSMSLTAAEARGALAFTHYRVGDLVTAEIATDEPVVDEVSSIAVEVDAAGSITVKPTIGDPSASQPMGKFAALVRQVRRDVRNLERGNL